MLNFFYVPLVGFPICAICCMVGLMLCMTIIGIPIGLPFFALGFKALTIPK